MTNAEKYKTAKERAEAFSRFCNSFVNTGCDKCPCKCSCYDLDSNGAFYWLDLEAEEEKPLPCPFCGANMIVCDNAYNHRTFCACEKRCGYISQYGDSEQSVISAHNRVARAVMAAKEAAK